MLACGTRSFPALLNRTSNSLGVPSEPQTFGKSGFPNLRNSQRQVYQPACSVVASSR
jgi:hypothetical protein